MLITAGWRRLFRRNCIWVVINDSEVTYGYKKSESSLNLRAFLKNPHLRVLFIYIIFVFPVILTFSFFLPEDIPNTFSNLIPENF